MPEDVSYIKTQCPLCDGAFEFPAHAFGQRTDCPHCHKAIVLGSVAALAQTQKNPSVVEQPPSLNQINVNQRILIGVALVAFVISVCNASWEVTSFDYDGKIHDKVVMYSFIWQQPEPLPYSVTVQPRHECHLFWPPLIGIWITIGVVFTGSFFLLKNTPSILELIKKLKP